MKIVINNCFGGFGFSRPAEEAYLKLKGKEAFFYKNARDERKQLDFSKYIKIKARSDAFLSYTFTKDLGDSFVKGEWPDDGSHFSAREISRDDSDLVLVVSEMGEKADGDHASLKIVEIPDGTDWQIAEYDGSEHVAEKHRTWS